MSFPAQVVIARRRTRREAFAGRTRRRGGSMNESGVAARWRSWSPYLLSLLRIVSAFLFIQVGTAKLFAFPGAVMPGGGTAPAWSLAWIAGVLETFGGFLILVGL